MIRFSDHHHAQAGVMIAPESNHGKGLGDALRARPADHGFVNEIILLPNFGQGAAKLRGKIATVVTS
jgi:hypothetical protein